MRRFVFDRLPIKGYQDNDPTDWLTQWVDVKLKDKVDQLEDFYTKLDPLTTDNYYLDYLAFLVGMSSQYWVKTWNSSVKRQLITLASYLWRNRGTLLAVKTVLDIHILSGAYTDGDDIPLADGDDVTFADNGYTIWISEGVRLPFVLSAQLGRDALAFYVLLPLSYSRKGYEFIEARRTLKNFAPATVQTLVAYEKFYLGFSVVGDPLFRVT